MNYNISLVCDNAKPHSSYCHYEIFSAKDESLNKIFYGACHSQIRKSPFLKSDEYVLLYLSVKSLPYSLISLLRWIYFLRTINFKAKYIGKRKVYREGEGNWALEFNEEIYVVRMNYADYKNKLHIFAAITAFRYIYYSFSIDFINIPQRVFELKKIYGNRLGNFQAISLAYYTLNCEEVGHAFIANREYEVNLISLEEFNERVSNGEERFLNNVLQGKVKGRSYELREAYAEKDYKKLAKLAEIKYTK